MYWKPQGVRIQFYDLGGQDPCGAETGAFCRAYIDGREWATTRGLQVGEPARRVVELHPRAQQVVGPGPVIRYVIDPGVAPCGPDGEGFAIWTSGAKVVAFVVTYSKGGD